MAPHSRLVVVGRFEALGPSEAAFLFQSHAVGPTTAFIRRREESYELELSKVSSNAQYFGYDSCGLLRIVVAAVRDGAAFGWPPGIQQRRQPRLFGWSPGLFVGWWS